MRQYPVSAGQFQLRFKIEKIDAVFELRRLDGFENRMQHLPLGLGQRRKLRIGIVDTPYHNGEPGALLQRFTRCVSIDHAGNILFVVQAAGNDDVRLGVNRRAPQVLFFHRLVAGVFISGKHLGVDPRRDHGKACVIVDIHRARIKRVRILFHPLLTGGGNNGRGPLHAEPLGVNAL